MNFNFDVFDLISEYGAISTKEYLEFVSYKDQDLLKNYETIIVFLFPYETKKVQSSEIEKYPAAYSRSLDYHNVAKNLMDKAVNALKTAGFLAESLIDNSFINEQKAALIAGLGSLGKNNLVLNKKFGTHFFIGTILTNLKFQKKLDFSLLCGDCNKCITSCPVNALAPFYDYKKCLSYLSQAKIPFTKENIKSIKVIFGCDICQDSCPFNKVSYDGIISFDENAKIDLLELFTLNNQEFKNKYSKYAFSWRGLLVLKRNALCILFNQKYDIKDLLIQELKNDTPWYHETVINILEMVDE